jgi:serine/threonine protein kinase
LNCVLPRKLQHFRSRRFQREAQLASSLNHPHILTVHDVGEFDGSQYLVSEFVDGGRFKDSAEEPRSWRQVVDLLIGVADALATAAVAESDADVVLLDGISTSSVGRH